MTLKRAPRSAQLVELLGDGISNGTAHTAADNCNLFQSFHMGRNTQRAYKIVNAVTLVQAVQLFGSCTDNLEDNGHQTGLPVIIGNRQGNPLAVFVHTQNNELSGLCFFCNQRGLHFHEGHGGVQFLLFNDLIHESFLRFAVSLPENREGNRLKIRLTQDAAGL